MMFPVVLHINFCNSVRILPLYSSNFKCSSVVTITTTNLFHRLFCNMPGSFSHICHSLSKVTDLLLPKFFYYSVFCKC